LAAALRSDSALGYIETRAYRELSAAFRAEFVPLVATNRISLVASRETLERLAPDFIPFFIR